MTDIVAPDVAPEPKDLRMKETVHIADPSTSAVSVIKEGDPVPPWAVGLMPADLVYEAEPGAMPLSMVGSGGPVLPAASNDGHGTGQDLDDDDPDAP